MIVKEIFYGIECDRCKELHNDEDRILVYDDYPEYLNSVINFIQGALKKRVDVIDKCNSFVIKSTSWHEFFKERDIDYLKSVLHDKYCEFTFDKGMRNETITIKIKK